MQVNVRHGAFTLILLLFGSQAFAGGGGNS